MRQKKTPARKLDEVMNRPSGTRKEKRLESVNRLAQRPRRHMHVCEWRFIGLGSTYSYQMLGICVGSAAALADALAWKHDVERNTSVHGNERHGLPVNRNVATGGRPQNQHGKKRRERNSTHGSGSINATDHTAQGRVTVQC